MRDESLRPLQEIIIRKEASFSTSEDSSPTQPIRQMIRIFSLTEPNSQGKHFRYRTTINRVIWIP